MLRFATPGINAGKDGMATCGMGGKDRATCGMVATMDAGTSGNDASSCGRAGGTCGMDACGMAMGAGGICGNDA